MSSFASHMQNICFRHHMPVAVPSLFEIVCFTSLVVTFTLPHVNVGEGKNTFQHGSFIISIFVERIGLYW